MLLIGHDSPVPASACSGGGGDNGGGAPDPETGNASTPGTGPPPGTSGGSAHTFSKTYFSQILVILSSFCSKFSTFWAILKQF